MIATLAGLAGCGPTPVPQGTFRQTTVPIYSNATFDFGRLPGQWQQAAAFAVPGAGACPAGRADIAPDLAVTLHLCLNGTVVQARGRIAPAGPGRFRITGADAAGIGQDWWVVWVDVGYRTLAIGTPSGAFGFVLNRDGPLPGDRFDAASEIFDFNGYDRSKLIRLR